MPFLLLVLGCCSACHVRHEQRHPSLCTKRSGGPLITDGRTSTSNIASLVANTLKRKGNGGYILSKESLAPTEVEMPPCARASYDSHVEEASGTEMNQTVVEENTVYESPTEIRASRPGLLSMETTHNFNETSSCTVDSNRTPISTSTV